MAVVLIPGRVQKGRRPLAPMLNHDCALADGRLVTWPMYGPNAIHGLGSAIGLTNSDPVLGPDPLLGGLAWTFSPAVSRPALSSVPVPFAGGSFSVSAWCMTNTTSSSSGGGGLRDLVSTETGGSNEFVIRYSPTIGHFEAYVLGGGNSVVTSSVTLATFTPYHVLMTVDTVASVQAFYVNGVSQGTVAPATTVSSKTFNIGTDQGFDSGVRAWSGWISDVTVWGYALTARDAWSLYDPATRWDGYWTPGNRAYGFQPGVVFDAATFPYAPITQPLLLPREVVPSGRVA